MPDPIEGVVRRDRPCDFWVRVPSGIRRGRSLLDKVSTTWGRAVVRVAVVWATLAAICPPTIHAIVATGASATSSPPHTFIFVLDGSGSMIRGTVADGRTRWDAAKQSIAQTMESLPEGFACEMIVFGSRVEPSDWARRWVLDDARGRADATSFARRPVQRGGRPWNRRDEGTALYDAMGWAFERAGELCEQGSEATVVVLSDGDDADSRRWNPDGRGGRRSLCDKLAELRRNCVDGISYRFVRDNRSIVPPCDPDAVGEGIVFVNLPVTVVPDGPTEFASLAEGPQEIRLRVDVPEDFARSGLERMSVRFLPRPGDPGVAVAPRDIPLVDGSVTLTATAVGEPSDEPVRGTLTFLIGATREPTAVVVPPRDLPIGFAARAKVSLDPASVVPPDGAAFLKGRPIRFAAPEVAGGTASWQFGDGESASGFAVTHAYAAEGEKSFTLSVTKPGSTPFNLTRTIRVVDISVAIVPPAEIPMAGEEIALEARTTGPVEDLRWQIDSFDVAAGSDGRLRYRFPGPGTFQARVIAVTAFGEFDARLPIEVGEGASIAIVQPDAAVPALVPTSFAAVVTGPIEEVRWTLVDDAGQVVDPGLEEGIDRVEPIGEGRVSRFTFALPATAKGPISITAAAIVPDRLASRIAALEDRVEREVLPPGLFTTIVSPIAGETLPYDRQAGFAAQLAGSGLAEVTGVRWTFVGEDGSEIAVVDSSVERAADRAEGVANVVFTPLPEHGGRISVTAQPLGAGTFDPASSTHTLRLDTPDYVLRAPDCTNGIAGLGRNVKFEIEPTTHLRSARFEFGDGGRETVEAESGEAACFHRFTTGGVFDVRAVATLADGRTIDIGPLRLLVEATPPKAVLRATIGGDSLVDSELVAGGTIAIADESTGDISSRRWILVGPIDADGEGPSRVIDPGAESVVVPEDAIGTHRLRLEVVGIPERPGTPPPTDSVEIAFENRLAKDLRWTALAATLGMLASIATWLFVRSRYPRLWRVETSCIVDGRRQGPERSFALHEATDYGFGDGWNGWRRTGRLEAGAVLPRGVVEALAGDGGGGTYPLCTIDIAHGSEPIETSMASSNWSEFRSDAADGAESTYRYSFDPRADHDRRIRDAAGGEDIGVELTVVQRPAGMFGDAQSLLILAVPIVATVGLVLYLYSIA